MTICNLVVAIRKHDHMKQAIYCYSKAIKANNNDLDALWDRSYLYGETGQLKKVMYYSIFISISNSSGFSHTIPSNC
jgi:hypothetical protein